VCPLLGLFVSEIGEQLQGAPGKSLFGVERGSYCRISQLPSCEAKLALISIFLNQILSGFKLISVIINQIVMRGETGGFFVSVNLFTAPKMEN
jgi:hypothetical protein